MLDYRGRYFYVNPSLPYTSRVVKVPAELVSDLKNYPHRQYTILNAQRRGYDPMYLLDIGLWVHEEDLLPARTSDNALYNPGLRSSDVDYPGTRITYGSDPISSKWTITDSKPTTNSKKKEEALDWDLFNKKLPLLNQNL